MSRPLLASRSQLVALRREAQEAGDGDQARLCTLALDGDHDALARCTEVIVEALGNGEPDLLTVTAVADLLGLSNLFNCGMVIVNVSGWHIRAFKGTDQPGSGGPHSRVPGDVLCWSARPQDGTASGRSGTWRCACDIEDTLRALGGVE